MPLKQTNYASNLVNDALARVHWNEDTMKTRIFHALVGALIGYYALKVFAYASLFVGLCLLAMELVRSVLMVPVNWQRMLTLAAPAIAAFRASWEKMNWNWLMCRGFVSGLMLGASCSGMPFWHLLLLRPVLGI